MRQDSKDPCIENFLCHLCHKIVTKKKGDQTLVEYGKLLKLVTQRKKALKNTAASSTRFPYI